MRQSVENVIQNKILQEGHGWCFTPFNFQDFGSSESVRGGLFNLHRRGFIRHLAQGIDDYPKVHETLGAIPADLNKIAQAIAEKNGVQIQPSGAHAANLAGLSEQVPGKVIFLTAGHSRKGKIGK